MKGLVVCHIIGISRLSGPELVSRLGLTGGQNSVAGAVRDFRRNVTEVLLAERGLTCGPQDVIRSGGPGYRLNEWITVRMGNDAFLNSDILVDYEDDTDNRSRTRCEWIIAELNRGRKLRTAKTAAPCRCSTKTAKRELDALRSANVIEFVGPTRTGYYRIKAAT